jgi:hypothetical protein
MPGGLGRVGRRNSVRGAIDRTVEQLDLTTDA